MTVRKPRTRYHHGDLKAALVKAAIEVAARSGVDAIVLTTLARRTGVTGTAPFRHFPTREALLLAAAEDAAQRLVARTQAAVSGVEDPLEAQKRAAAAYVRFAVEDPGSFRVLSRPEALQSPVVAALDGQARAAMEAVFGGGENPVSDEVARRSAGHLAAQALVYGLARLLVDGHLGPVNAETAERLTAEVLAHTRLG